MTKNRSRGESPDDLHERAVAALVREWGVTETEARDAMGLLLRESRVLTCDLRQ